MIVEVWLVMNDVLVVVVEVPEFRNCGGGWVCRYLTVAWNGGGGAMEECLLAFAVENESRCCGDDWLNPTLARVMQG